ncbi:MAG: hypothetical protein ITG00_09985 [Flavobacterium sp.]|nr:hypothetical protein [Flavobacterium sp.]
MDSKYIITRLKSTPYKFPTAQIIKTRLENLEAAQRQQVVSHLKIELCKECNLDIYEPLADVVHRLPAA